MEKNQAFVFLIIFLLIIFVIFVILIMKYFIKFKIPSIIHSIIPSIIPSISIIPSQAPTKIDSLFSSSNMFSKISSQNKINMYESIDNLGFSFSLSETTLVIGNKDNTISIYDLKNGGQPQIIKTTLTSLTKVVVSKDGETIVVASAYNNKVIIYNYDLQGKWIVQTEISKENGNFGSSISLSHDGSLLAIGCPKYSNTGAIYIYGSEDNVFTEKSVIYGTDEVIGYNISLSADGHTLATILTVITQATSSSSATVTMTNVKVEIYKAENYNFVIEGSIPVRNAQTVNLSENGNRMVIGCADHINICDRIDGTWKSFEINHEGNNENSAFGISAVISLDGETIAVTGGSNIFPDYGVVWILKYNGEEWKIYTQINKEFNFVLDVSMYEKYLVFYKFNPSEMKESRIILAEY